MLSKAVDYLMQGMAPQLSQSKQALIGDLREETWGKALMFLFQKEITTISKETKTPRSGKSNGFVSGFCLFCFYVNFV